MSRKARNLPLRAGARAREGAHARPPLGISGEKTVDVLNLNLALDAHEDS